MGARNVAEIIRGTRYVSNVKWEYDSKLEFDYERPSDFLPKTYKVYMPSRDDYEVSIDVVDKAVEYGADLIVYDNWIKATISGKSHAEKKGIRIYSYGYFLRKIKNGEPI